MYIGLYLNNETNGTGLLEYFTATEWVPVCFTEAFDECAADEACQQLGYPFATNFSFIVLPVDRPGIGITRSYCKGTSSGYLFSCVDFKNMICQMELHLTCYNSKYSYHKYSIYVVNRIQICF